MSTITRGWLAFAAIGTGLIHFALVIGSPPGLGIVLAIVGLAEFGWGVLVFASETVVLPRVVLVAALVPVLAWGLLLVASTVSGGPGPAVLPFLPLAVASLFELFIAATIGTQLRRNPVSKPRAGSAGRYLLGLVAGGLVAVGLTATALAATGPGASPQPDSGRTGSPFTIPEHSH